MANPNQIEGRYTYADLAEYDRVPMVVGMLLAQAGEDTDEEIQADTQSATDVKHSDESEE